MTALSSTYLTISARAGSGIKTKLYPLYDCSVITNLRLVQSRSNCSSSSFFINLFIYLIKNKKKKREKNRKKNKSQKKPPKEKKRKKKKG
jgi:hypothetical protein